VPRASTVTIAAFVDPRAAVWGIVIGGRQPLLATAPLRGDGLVQAHDASLRGAPQNGSRLDPGREWELSGSDVGLTLGPADGGAVSDGTGGLLELCTVQGEVRDSAQVRRIDCGGARFLADTDCDSLRVVGCWFESGRSVALRAERPRGAEGHGSDRVAAILTGEAEGIHLYDPRLSTTYGGDGSPRRAGIELWIGESEDEQRFRRLSLETLPGGGELSSESLRLECHAVEGNLADSRGEGVYLLARGG
jgi:hypothetical protein